jgi:hypothetical protein
VGVEPRAPPRHPSPPHQGPGRPQCPGPVCATVHGSGVDPAPSVGPDGGAGVRAGRPRRGGGARLQAGPGPSGRSEPSRRHRVGPGRDRGGGGLPESPRPPHAHGRRPRRLPGIAGLVLPRARVGPPSHRPGREPGRQSRAGDPGPGKCGDTG